MVSELGRVSDPRLLVGADTADDAGVYLLEPGLALVQTVDFITPILDDPRDFGAVAAANSLSDVYAMGGTPLTALNVVCFPEDKLPLEVLVEILRGSAAKCAEAGCVVAGGHTVSDPELKFGLSVTGRVDPDRVLRNSTSRPGDVLVLSKGLGTGVLSTALKKGKLPAPELAALVASMSALNDRAGAAAASLAAHAATDVTGFGLVGHAFEMASGAGVRSVIEASRLPQLPGAADFAARGFLTGADRRNRDFVGAAFRMSGAVPAPVVALAFDAQTSGGLLVALAPERVSAYLEQVPGAVAIGRVEAGAAEVVLES